jgi:hypothetical protein
MAAFRVVAYNRSCVRVMNTSSGCHDVTISPFQIESEVNENSLFSDNVLNFRQN